MMIWRLTIIELSEREGSLPICDGDGVWPGSMSEAWWCVNDCLWFSVWPRGSVRMQSWSRLFRSWYYVSVVREKWPVADETEEIADWHLIIQCEVLFSIWWRVYSDWLFGIGSIDVCVLLLVKAVNDDCCERILLREWSVLLVVLLLLMCGSIILKWW